MQCKTAEERKKICARCEWICRMGDRCINPRKGEIGGVCLTSDKRFNPWENLRECVHWVRPIP